MYSSICADPQRLHHRYSALKEIKLPLRHSKTGKIVPVRLREFSEIRLLPHLHSDKSAFHNIIQHYGYVLGIASATCLHKQAKGQVFSSLKSRKVFLKKRISDRKAEQGKKTGKRSLNTSYNRHPIVQGLSCLKTRHREPVFCI